MQSAINKYRVIYKNRIVQNIRNYVCFRIKSHYGEGVVCSLTNGKLIKDPKPSPSARKNDIIDPAVSVS